MKFIPTFLGSFYSAPMYCELRNSKGHGLGYSFMLVLVTLFLTCAAYAPLMNRLHQELFVGVNGKISVMDDVLRQVANQTPIMSVKNEVLSTKVPRAHVIHLKTNVMGNEAEGDAITIDTTGATSYANMKTPILITAHEVITKQDNETRIKKFKELGNVGATQNGEPFEITPEIAKDAAETISDLVRDNIRKFYLIVGSVMLIVMGIALYIARIVTLLLLAAGGLLIANILRTKLGFESAMRMAAVSFTPVAVLGAIIPAFGNHAIGGLTMLLLGLVTLSAAIYVTRDSAQVV